MIRVLTIFLILLTAQGCAIQGRLYSNLTEPYSKNFNKTPIGTKTCVIKDHRLREPISNYNFSAEWTNETIAAAAEKAGLSEIYYADIHTFSLLFEIYRKRTLILYGE